MLKKFLASVLAVAGMIATASTSSAAFNLTVTNTGGVAFPAYSSMGATTSGGLIDIFDGNIGVGTDLLLNFNITNNPSAPNFTINTLQLLYNNNPGNTSYTISISENAATYPGGPGASLTGFTSYSAVGNVNSTFSSVTTFTGTGANTITFPLVNFSNVSTNYVGSTTFTSLGSPGAIVLDLLVDHTNNSNVNFATGQGVVGIQAPAVPVPATAIAGLMAIPALAAIRRRRASN
jgi:hypothetical protein